MARPSRTTLIACGLAAAGLTAGFGIGRSAATDCASAYLVLERLDTTVDGQPGEIPVAPGDVIFLSGREAGRIDLTVSTGRLQYREDFHAAPR